MFQISGKFIVFVRWARENEELYIPASGEYRLVCCIDFGCGEALNVIESEEDLEFAKTWKGSHSFGYFNIGR